MNKRLQRLGIGLVVMGFVFFAAGGYTLYKTQQGASALQTFSAAQNVKLNYNDQGQLVDRGETAGAAAIMSLLVNDWGYAVDKGELNPNDPLVNTASEYMYQMATISYHTLHATTTVTIPEDVVVDGQVVTKAGDVRVRQRRQVLDRLRPDRPDPGCGSRQDLDRHRACPDRRARRRQRDRLGPHDGPRHRRPLRPRRTHGGHDRPRAGVGDASLDREGQGPGIQAGGQPRLTTARRVHDPQRTPNRRGPERPSPVFAIPADASSAVNQRACTATGVAVAGSTPDTPCR